MLALFLTDSRDNREQISRDRDGKFRGTEMANIDFQR
jgi:hypothetical protein